MHSRTLALPVGIALTGLSQAVWAHEGHGPLPHQDGPAHYLLSPTHFVPWLVVAAAVLLVVVGVRNRLRATRRLQQKQPSH